MRSVFSRKREASTSLPDDPKRKDQLRGERIESDYCSTRLSPYHNNQFVLIPQFTLDSNQNSCRAEHPALVSHFTLDNNQNGYHVESSSSYTKNYVASEHHNFQLQGFLCQGEQTASETSDIVGSQNGNSSQDSSASSSISDLSIHSATGNSVGIQEDLDCLHLSDEVAFQSAILKEPLVPSLFPNVPPTIYFSTEDEKVHPLPSVVCELLKWKLSSITPVCIRQTVERAGFQLVKPESTDWVGTWGKHVKLAAFKNIRESQKVNHFPGSFHLGRKDKMSMNYSKMFSQYGDEDFSFFPETFVLPQDIRRLRHAWGQEGSEKRWIIKPPASARGTGIKVINRWAQIPKKSPVVVQRYLIDPYLINGAKFDLRLYILVPSYEPLRIYMFPDGLVRFASVKYCTSSSSLSDPFVHLTNYSINRKNSSYTANDDENTCQGHKWSLKSLWKYLEREESVDVKSIQEEIVDLVIKTIICSEGPMTRLIKTHAKSRYNCFELFGFDIMLDKDLKPWLLEVNISPSLHTSSALDMKIKGQLAKDMLNIAGFRVPEKVTCCAYPIDPVTGSGISQEKIQNMCMNKALYRENLSPDEKIKHMNFMWSRQYKDQDVLDNLTPDDVRQLIESEDELSRSGCFKRIFPTESTSQYLRFFDHSRYYNILFDAWERKYHNNRNEGNTLLANYCLTNFHLQTAYGEPSFPTISS